MGNAVIQAEAIVKTPFQSFRASGARHGIQYFQYVLDAGSSPA